VRRPRHFFPFGLLFLGQQEGILGFDEQELQKAARSATEEGERAEEGGYEKTTEQCQANRKGTSAYWILIFEGD